MKKYNVIYADPPWRYGDKVLNNGHGKRFDGLDKHYSVMSLLEIMKLPVSNISDDNCVLFLWTTDSHIPEALNVIKSWGFVYKTIAFYWMKTSKKTGKFTTNLGKWTQKNGEICLFATRGKCSSMMKQRNIHQLVISPRRGHSEKPIEVKNRIERMFGCLPRIELFAREKTEGWDVWGDEVDSDIVL